MSTLKKTLAKIVPSSKKRLQCILWLTSFIFVVSLTFLVASIIKNTHSTHSHSSLHQNNTSPISQIKNIQAPTTQNFTPNDIEDDTPDYLLGENTKENSHAIYNDTTMYDPIVFQQLSQLFDANNLNSNLIPYITSSSLNTNNLHDLEKRESIKNSPLHIFTFKANTSQNPIEVLRTNTLSSMIEEIYAHQNIEHTTVASSAQVEQDQNKQNELFQLLHIAQDINGALIQTLTDCAIPLEDIHFKENAIRVDTQLKPYPFLTLELSQKEKALYFTKEDERETFIGKLQQNLNNTRKNTSHIHTKSIQTHIVDEKEFIYIRYKNIISHVIRFEPRKDRTQKINPLDKNTYYCTVVIDDVGENFTLARKFMNLPFPVVFSIWPQSTHATSIATIAHEKGLPIFLHQPMEAMLRNNYAPDIGASGLTTEMTQEEMKKVLQYNILSVPHLRGINNHMGSLFTSTPIAVENFLRAIKSLMPQIFILDSVTHANSCLFLRASAHNFLTGKRDFFIDNNDQNITKELNNVHRHAKEHRHVYAIGHARPKTLTALQNWNAQHDKNLAFTLPSY